MPDLEIVSVAEDCFEVRVEATTDAHRLGDQLRTTDVFESVVPGLQSLAVRFDPRLIDESEVEDRIRQAMRSLASPAAAKPAEEYVIRVRYGGENGPDFDDVCARTGLTPDALIAQHSAPVYGVDLIGFTPGFTYLAGLPKSLYLPRRDTPRIRLPAGSIGIAGAYSGIYAMAGPGGWSIIGITEDVLFDSELPDPFLVKPGMTIRFESI